MNKKALALLSGGLDSILAAKLMLEQGIDVKAINFSSVFCSCSGKSEEHFAEKAAQTLGIPLKIIDFTEEFIEVIKNPRHGYGANINPCIDCRIFMLKKAKEYMNSYGASFIVTGEVLGERPMSQRKDALSLIDKRSETKGIVLRPLSAKLMEVTIPEKEGIVDRDMLMDIRGRSRRPQFALAKKFGITEYPTPAGGCLLTDPGFARRVKDLINHSSLTSDGLKLLRLGRHFRLSERVKLVVGRDESENQALESMAGENDILIKLKDYQGPLSIIKGEEISDKIIKMAASIASYHTKFRNEQSLDVDYWPKGAATPSTISVKPATQDEIEPLRI